MESYAQQERVEFGTWYSGMEKEKVKNAFQRFIKETKEGK
jgi:hypothetical protein